MDRRQANISQMGRERAVYDYLKSLESGDIDGIIEVLHQALYDASLDQMVVDAHQTYIQEEQIQQATLVDRDTQKMPALEAGAPRSRVSEQRRRTRERQLPRWTQVLAAVLIVGVLLGSFVTALVVRQQGGQGAPTPLSTPLPACQPYPLKQFDAQNNVTTATSLNMLSSVTAISTNDAWAVGRSNSPPTAQPISSRTFIEHWDGKNWHVVPSPNRADDNSSLSGVAAVSANDVWAVGMSFHGRSSRSSIPLVEHWDGKSWHVVPSPTGLTGNGTLLRLTVISKNNIWAVGSFNDVSLRTYPFIVHWDGMNWHMVSLRGSAGSIVGLLYDVGAATANDIWAIGMGRNEGEKQMHGLVMHWNGSQWQSELTSSAASKIALLDSISVLSAQDLWTTGFDSNWHPLIEHWDGRHWNSVVLPGPWAGTNTSITAVSANDIWVLGGARGSDQVRHILILHWNGKSWRQVSLPALQLPDSLPNTFADGMAVSGGQIWIVGYAKDSEGGYTSALILGQRTCP